MTSPLKPPARPRENRPKRADDYRCGTCGRAYPVPSLASDCQRRHQEDQ